MDRKLKFKAYEKNTGIFWDVAEVEALEDDFDLNNSNLVVQRNVEENKDIDGWETKVLNKGEFILLRFTGKLDSNNVEVYEGAIVTYKSRTRYNRKNDNNFELCQETGIIIWKDFSYKIDMFNPSYSDERFYSLNQTNLKVVGHALSDKNYLRNMVVVK